MTLKTIFDTCQPRADVLAGTVSEAEFAADLASVVARDGPSDYGDPARFFLNTYPTRGLKTLLANVCRRLSGTGGEAAAIFRLDTSYGGGKTHGLIALAHAARGMAGVAEVGEFLDPALVPPGPVRLAVFDGENADPANGRDMGGGVLARTPWGEIAHGLAGPGGYERLRRSDERAVAPGAGTLRELFGGEPTLILLDELSVWLRKAKRLGSAGDQLTAFLTSLFKAVEGAPGAALVYTLAIGRDGGARDAYSEENQFIAARMAEAESVSARKATLLNPTEDDETALVLRRRLFERVDEDAAETAVEAYRSEWSTAGDRLSPEAGRLEVSDEFRQSYPLHPDVLRTLTSKTATLDTFQRVRGMLRLLGRTVARLWEVRPDDATAIHLHHVDLGHEPIRQEILTRLQQQALAPAIGGDIAGTPGKPALAEELDREHHRGLPPYTAYVARTAFLHTLAFNDPLKGVSAEGLRFSMLGPSCDISFIEAARKRFLGESAYLDDRPGAPLRFLAEANLTQILRREEQQVDAGDARTELNAAIREIFAGKTFEATCFPGGPFDVPDDVGDGRPKLVVLGYDAATVNPSEVLPELARRIYERKGTEGAALRQLRNNVVFVVADESRRPDMSRRARRRLALQALSRADRLVDLAEHQRAQIRELEKKSLHELATAIQQCYRHLLYPSRNRVEEGGVDLAHAAVDIPAASHRPGVGQVQVERALRDLNKVRGAEDDPDSPAYIRSRTPLRRGEITTAVLRGEFRRDPGLPILIGDSVFIRGIRQGVERGEYVYRRGELLYGQGEPAPEIAVDEQAFVYTTDYARNRGIWPRPASEEPAEPRDQEVPPGPPDDTSGEVKDAKEHWHTRSPRTEVAAEGVLREALTRLWEQARGQRMDGVGKLTIRLFEAGDGFRLLGSVGAEREADKLVKMEGAYETRDNGSFRIEFEGPVSDAQLVREFFEPQLRDARHREFEIGFELTFAETLPLAGDAPEALTERLCRHAGGAAWVAATAAAEGS